MLVPARKMQRVAYEIQKVFKSFKGINPVYIQNIFDVKDQPYFLRNPLLLIQTKKKTTNYGLRSFNYLGSKMWNDLPAHFKDISDVDITTFKSLLKQWPGPDCDASENPFL